MKTAENWISVTVRIRFSQAEDGCAGFTCDEPPPLGGPGQAKYGAPHLVGGRLGEPGGRGGQGDGEGLVTWWSRRSPGCPAGFAEGSGLGTNKSW